MDNWWAEIFHPSPRFLTPKEILELTILKFYHDVFQKEDYESRHVKDALNRLRSAYCKNSISSVTSAVTFDSPDMRCAYLFHFAPCFASAVASHFHDVLFYNPWLMEKILQQDTLTVTCLGGGPATELVAVVKVLVDMLWKYCPRGGRPLEIHATVIDVDPGWKDTVENVGENLKNLLNPSLMRYQVFFAEADLTKPLSEQVQEILERSDIVTMVKFLTAVHGSAGREGISSSLQNIVQHIRANGILFFLDSSRFQHHDLLRNTLRSLGSSMRQIYGLWEYAVHEMSPIFMVECCRLYFKYFQAERCCTRSTNCVSAWYRT